MYDGDDVCMIMRCMYEYMYVWMMMMLMLMVYI